MYYLKTTPEKTKISSLRIQFKDFLQAIHYASTYVYNSDAKIIDDSNKELVVFKQI